MNEESRLYRIGGHAVKVRLERPWTFKALTEQQKELVARLQGGGGHRHRIRPGGPAGTAFRQ
jgi:hypothetical protein